VTAGAGSAPGSEMKGGEPAERGPRRQGARESQSWRQARQWSAPTTTSGVGGGRPISAYTAREEAKPEGIERWSSTDHRSGLGSGGGGRRREIRRCRWHEVRGVAAWWQQLVTGRGLSFF
jgi:hypothetical protein